MRIAIAALAACAVLAPLAAQADPTSDAILRRLDNLERENTALRHEVQAIRAERRGPRHIERAAVVARRPTPAAIVVASEPEAAPFSWQGLHVGVFGGLNVANPTFGTRDVFSDGTSGTNAGSLSSSPTFAGVYGAEAGWDWQRGVFVYGVEGDVASVASTRNVGSEVRNEDYLGEVVGSYSKTTAVATLRARAGLALDRTLIFGTIGLGEIHSMQTVSVGTPAEYLSHAAWTPALVVGGGIEYALTNHLAIKGEAIYLAAATQEFSASFPPAGGEPIEITYGLTPSQTIARAAVDYKF